MTVSSAGYWNRREDALDWKRTRVARGDGLRLARETFWTPDTRLAVAALGDLGGQRLLELACAQDVGKALNPLSVVGQIQGGTTQGLGMAVMEEILVDPKTAKVRNPSFTDYLIPTILDTPTMPVDVLELADAHAPYGLRGVGEAPTLSSTPAVLAAIRNATGLELNRTPVRPEHLTAT